MFLLHYVCYCVIDVSVRANYFFRVLYVGPGARLVVSLEGRGAQLWRHPGSNCIGYTSNGHLV